MKTTYLANNNSNKALEKKGQIIMKNGYRILAGNEKVSIDTYSTKLNNNDLVIGGSGSGKTSGYIKPNIANTTEQSIVVADTKGNLYGKFKDLLESRGYTVYNIDFKDLCKSPNGYNPFDYIRVNEDTGNYSQQDVQKLASFLCPVNKQSGRDDFWDEIAQSYISCAIAYIMETEEKEDRNMKTLLETFRLLDKSDFKSSIDNLLIENPDSFAASCFYGINKTSASEKTNASAMAVLNTHLFPFMSKEALSMYCNDNKVYFEELGNKKTALFLTISDSESSMYRAVNMLYRDAFDSLIKLADSQSNSRLKIPVHFYLDDFATNTLIPDFDNLISVIRSRDISVSIIVQNISQLRERYNGMANTIIANCDHIIYLGCTDQDTASFISFRMNIMPSSICNLPRDKAYILETGKKYVSTDKYFFDDAIINKLQEEEKDSMFKEV